ncbi:MAG: DNA-directed RNA polymerase subunit omega [Firmicutes bacterium]|nr:DNA-directed RNA polymerase subunit omega [Bacillota bacterium]
MLYPEINKLRDAAGSRYFLVSMAAKRARDIIDGSPKLDETITTNIPVSIAAEEISQGLFTYTMLQEETEEESEYPEEEVEYIEEEEAEAEEIEAETEETL